MDDKTVSFEYDEESDGWYNPEENYTFTLCGKMINIIFVDSNNSRYYLYENEVIFSGDKVKAVQDLQEAARYLERYSPLYAHWVKNVLNDVVLVGRTATVTINRSQTNTPASVVLSHPTAEPDDIPQILVHECTHNYLHLCTVIEPIDNGSDSKLYYSPVKKTGRPIMAILVTYHAFVNVKIFLEQCHNNNAPNTEYNLREIEDMKNHTDPLFPYLYNSTGLTQTGRAFWVPLAKKVGHLDIYHEQ